MEKLHDLHGSGPFNTIIYIASLLDGPLPCKNLAQLLFGGKI